MSTVSEVNLSDDTMTTKSKKKHHQKEPVYVEPTPEEEEEEVQQEKKVPVKVNKEEHQPATQMVNLPEDIVALTKRVKEMQAEVDQVKEMVTNMYAPKHLNSMMQKVGEMETSINGARQSAQNCLHLIFVVFVVFALLVLGVAFVMWKMNNWKGALVRSVLQEVSRDMAQYQHEHRRRKVDEVVEEEDMDVYPEQQPVASASAAEVESVKPQQAYPVTIQAQQQGPLQYQPDTEERTQVIQVDVPDQRQPIVPMAQQPMYMSNAFARTFQVVQTEA